MKQIPVVVLIFMMCFSAFPIVSSQSRSHTPAVVGVNFVGFEESTQITVPVRALKRGKSKA